MKHISQPALWLILLIAGLPQLSETVYTPALVDIAHALSVKESWVEYTLTIYLFGLGLGTLFWGKLSDHHGRKPCLLMGFFLYSLGCLGCYFSSSIEGLLLSRLLQSFGGSVGSVLGQAVCRDSFHGPALGKVYSSVGSALGLAPAIGPVIGGLLAQQFGWPSLFLFLILASSLVITFLALYLPETHLKEARQDIPFKNVLVRMIKDKKVIAMGLLVAGANGIIFSYYAEGPFCLIQLAGLSESQYGMTFWGLAMAIFTGGFVSRNLHASRSSEQILGYGLVVILGGAFLFSGTSLVFQSFWFLPTVTVTSMMILAAGFCMVNSNALSLALKEYRDCIGTASSLFGFFYYSVTSLITAGMGILHNGTPLPMPLYFLALSIAMMGVFYGVKKEKVDK